jgi:hypothetical protein
MLIWGEGDVGDKNTIEEQTVELEISGEDIEEEQNVEEEEEEKEQNEEEEEEEEQEEEEQEEETWDESYPAYPHSRINLDFHKQLEESYIYRVMVLSVYGLTLSFVACITALPLYELVVDMYDRNSHTIIMYDNTAVRDNTQFVARFPYIPAFLLSMSYLYPEMMSTLNIYDDRNAILTRLVLWLQFSLQILASFDNMIHQSIYEAGCLTIGTTILFVLFRLTSAKCIGDRVSIEMFSTIQIFVIVGYILYGLMCSLFITFGLIVILMPFLPGAFDLITRNGVTILYSVAIPSMAIFALYVMSSSFATMNDLCICQLFGSIFDLVIVSPRPGKYLIEPVDDDEDNWSTEDENEEEDKDKEDENEEEDKDKEDENDDSPRRR